MHRLRPLLPSLALFAGAALISAITMLDGIQPNDEGNVLGAAARIADGQVPYRDFWFFYPPGHLYLLGGLWELFGASLLPWRVLRVLCDAAVALLAYRLARRGGAPPRLAALAWLTAALAMAYPSGPHPFPLTLAMALGSLLLFERRPALAGVLAGLAGAWRIEFAAYLALGILVALVLRPGTRAVNARAAARFAGAALLAAALIYVPTVALAGTGNAWEQLVRFPVQRFGDLQSLPFPLSYDGPLNTSSPGGFLSDSAEELLLFYLPLALVVGLAAALACLGLRAAREHWWQAATAVFAVGMAHYLVARPDLFHTAPLAVMVAVLAAWALAPGVSWAAGLRGRALAMAGVVAAGALGYGLVEGLDRRWLELRNDYSALGVPVADGVRAAPRQVAELEPAVAAVRARVPAGEPIYVTTRRADQVSAGYPLFYLLAARHNPSRYDVQQGGVVTTEPVQREIVCDIDRARVRVVVRWTSAASVRREPNESGRPTGVRVLEDYLARAYRPWRRFGDFMLLARRGGAGSAAGCG